MAKKQKENEPQHRGKIQAQGGNLEESEAWAQDRPLTLNEGLTLLDKLKAKLPNKELLLRQTAFDKAKEFIEQAGENGGIDAQVSKTFRVTRDIRVDIEVIKGTAFLRINIIDNEE